MSVVKRAIPIKFIWHRYTAEVIYSRGSSSHPEASDVDSVVKILFFM